ncbi:MAG: class B sortase [Lachnospiraceae bacterium]|nr:class B sortase [Lachnospiraceae bacterium]
MKKQPTGRIKRNPVLYFLKRNGLLIVFGMIFIFAAVKLIMILADYERGRDIYASIRDSFTAPGNTIERTKKEETENTSRKESEAPESSGSDTASLPQTDPAEQTDPTDPPEPVQPTEYIVHHVWQDLESHSHESKLGFLHTTFDYILVPKYAFDMASLIAINPDVCGWIQIEGTHIDYPLVQGQDNEKYLRAAVTGEPNNAGSIFVDYRIKNPFDDRNTIMHGHNQRNSQMFHDLILYEQADFYKTHPYVKIYKPTGEVLIYRVFSGYYMTNTYTYKYNFANDESFQKYLDYAVGESIRDMDVRPDGTQRIITMSTCTNEADERRFVVHAFLVSEQ